MPEEWTGDVIKEMHLHQISFQQLAKEAGMHVKYLSKIMNGHCNPKGAESRIQSALKRLMDEQHYES